MSKTKEFNSHCPTSASSIVLDETMRELYCRIQQIGESSIPVLLLGETGCGKEVVAEWVHSCSGVAPRPFLRVNCAGLSESVVESELFGHERGAFTGAVQGHRGLFESADGGTLLLDELAELPLRTQAKLLRVLENGEFSRLGSTQMRKTNVRLIAATCRNLSELMESGEFRIDLYYRLCGARLEIPPLRERRTEIVPLAEFFLRRATTTSNAAERHFELAAKQALMNYHWPGNVRELRNVVEYAAALSPDSPISVSSLSLIFSVRPSQESRVRSETTREAPPACSPCFSIRTLREQVKHFECECIRAALNNCHGNQTRAARQLGISRRGLTGKLTEYGIARPRKLDFTIVAPATE